LKRSTKICIALGALFALASLVWMVFLPRIVERELRLATGFDIHVAVLRADPFTGGVVVRGFSAQNPKSYPTPEFVELRELHADVNLFSFFTDQIVINELDIDTEKIALIRQHDGKSNAGAFMAAFSGGSAPVDGKAPPPPPRKPRRYLVKKLHLKVQELIVADYTGLAIDKRSYKINIDETYNNVTDPKELLVPGVIKTLYGFGLHHDIAKLLPGDFGQALANAIGGAANVGSAFKKMVKGAFDKLDQSSKP
jgi:hypothetical protein